MPQDTRPATFQDLITAEAKKQGIDPRMALAIAEQESNFDPAAKGSLDEIGLFQLRPGTAKLVGVDPNDPIQNIRGGLTYFKQQLDANAGDVQKALGAYNAGPNGTANPAYAAGVLAKLARQGGAQGQSAGASGRPSFTNVVAGSSSSSDMRPVTSRSTPTATPPPPPRTKAEFVQQEMTRMGMDANAPPQPSLLSAFNPTDRQGRRNIAGAVGAVAGGLLTRSPQGVAAGMRLGTGLSAAVGSVVGAATAGGAAELSEQVAHGEPVTLLPGTQTERSSVAGAATQQGGYELAGQTFVWPVKAVGRRVVAAPVYRRATEALERQHEGVKLRAELAFQQAEEALRTTKQSASASVGNASSRLATPAPPTLQRSQAGQMVEEVVQGPARDTLKRLGAAVKETAQAGPLVPTAPLRQRLTELGMEVTPEAGATSVVVGGREFTVEQAKAILARNPELGLAQIPQELHLPATLALARETIEAGETLPFAEAHKIKRLLDDVINYDRPSKTMKAQITEGFRKTLRETMRGYEPYDSANAAYAKAVPLFRNKSLAAQLHKNAIDNPEVLVSLIRGSGKSANPTRLRNLFEVLDTYAAGSGGKVEGQAAKDAVRAAWTHENLIKGNPLELTKRIAGLDSEFASTMYGDPSGSTVLTNLTQIGNAIEQAVGQGKAAVLGAKEGVRTAGEAVSAARPRTSMQKALQRSSITRKSDVTVVGDVLRSVLAPWSSYGLTSTSRLFLEGPKIADLVQWMAYSPRITQLFVQAFTNPAAGMTVAQAARAAGLLPADLVEGILPVSSHAPADQPPPAPTLGTSSRSSEPTASPPPRPSVP